MIDTLVALVLFKAILEVVDACPTLCSCSTDSSGVKANCYRIGIGYVPKNIPCNTYFLNIGFNGISVIENGDFAGLAGLQTLYLNQNDIAVIEDGDFKGLVDLRDLYLYDNKISVIGEGDFEDLAGLQILYLSGNRLQFIAENTFANLKSLTFLNLAFNNIQVIDDGAFRGLNSLQRLDLDYNRLTSVAKNMFVNLQNLTQLYLKNNYLKYIAENTFVNLTSLWALHLKLNNISLIENQAFSNLPGLEYLDLRNNSITHIENQAFSNLPSLRHLWLDPNPLRCDCSILYLWTWFLKHPNVYPDGKCYNGTYIDVTSIQEADLYHCYDGPREVIISPLIQSYTVNETGILGPVSCTADCKPDCQIKWTGPNLPIGSKYVLNLLNISRNQAGEYYCTASNVIDSARSIEINLIVNYGPRDVIISTLIQSYTVNETANFGPVSCTADCKPDCLIKWTGPNLAISSKSVLNLQNISRYQTGKYYCTASNILGSARSIEINVIVNHAPYDITLSPTTLSYIVNETGNLGPIICTADCVPRCKIKWEGPNLPSDADQLNLKNISRNQNGKYHCIATNYLGDLVSSTVLIEVHHPCEKLILAKNENDEAILKAGISSLVIGIFMILITIVANFFIYRFRIAERKENSRSNYRLQARACNPAFTGVYVNASQDVLNTDTVNTTSDIGASAATYAYEDLQQNTRSKNDKRIYQTLQESGKGNEDMTSSQYINMRF